MAFDDKGAAWLQAGETIANPYFGASMLRCGVVRRSFAGASAAEDEHAGHDHGEDGR